MKTKSMEMSAFPVLFQKISVREMMISAAVMVCLLLIFAVPVGATPDDAVVFSGGTFDSASALAEKLGSENATASGNTLTLMRDINVIGTITITGDTTLLGYSHTIWRGKPGIHLINVTGGTLTLGDGTSQLTIHGQDDKFNKDTGNGWSLIRVTGSGTELTMKSGIIITNASIQEGEKKGIQPYNGAGVLVDSGANFTMDGGEISGNNANLGGGIYVNESTFTMAGGTISNNTAGENGGGVYVSQSTFTMEGGTISNNTAGNGGGGVGVISGTFTMDGGKISGNTAGFAGGIYVYNSSTFAMSGGTISNNTAGVGGGVWILQGSTLTMSGTAVIAEDNTVFAPSFSVNSSTAKALNITPENINIGTEVVTLTDAAQNNASLNNFGLSSQLRSSNHLGLKFGDDRLSSLVITAANRFFVVNGTINETGGTTDYYAPNVSIDITADAPEPNHVFAKWTSDNGGTFANPDAEKTTFTMPETAVNVTATYKDKPAPPSPSSGSADGNMNNAFRVLFNDGGQIVSVTTDLSSGDKLTAPASPAKDGYTFGGWYTDETCTKAWSFSEGISGDMTLYAKWTTTSGGQTTSSSGSTATAQATAPVAGLIFGLFAAGVLLRRKD